MAMKGSVQGIAGPLGVGPFANSSAFVARSIPGAELVRTYVRDLFVIKSLPWITASNSCGAVLASARNADRQVERSMTMRIDVSAVCLEGRPKAELVAVLFSSFGLQQAKPVQLISRKQEA